MRERQRIVGRVGIKEEMEKKKEKSQLERKGKKRTY